MRRFILFAAFQCFGILAICQSMAITPGTARSSPDEPTAHQSLFSFNGTYFGQVGQSFLSTKQESMPSCDGQGQSQNKANSHLDLNELFRVPCKGLRPNGIAIARVEMPPYPLATSIWPNAHFGPIPTQWPDAKVEQIPGRWPNLKMLPIAKQKTNSNPSK